MEEQCNIKWKSFLTMFGEINQKDKDAIEQYQQLKELAKLDNDMTPRQKSGIIDRCDYKIFMIENPDEEPFPNSERQEKRLNLPKEQSNGKT